MSERALVAAIPMAGAAAQAAVPPGETRFRNVRLQEVLADSPSAPTWVLVPGGPIHKGDLAK